MAGWLQGAALPAHAQQDGVSNSQPAAEICSRPAVPLPALMQRHFGHCTMVQCTAAREPVGLPLLTHAASGCRRVTEIEAQRLEETREQREQFLAQVRMCAGCGARALHASTKPGLLRPCAACGLARGRQDGSGMSSGDTAARTDSCWASCTGLPIAFQRAVSRPVPWLVKHHRLTHDRPCCSRQFLRAAASRVGAAGSREGRQDQPAPCARRQRQRQWQQQ